MKVISVTTLLLMSYLIAISQDMLLLYNGDKIECKNLKIDGEEVKLTDTKRGKITLPASTIKGLCSPKGEYVSTLKSEIKKDKAIYYFAENVVNGMINLYKRAEVNSQTHLFDNPAASAPGISNGTVKTMQKVNYVSYSLYIEKDNMYEELFMLNTISQNKSEKVKILKKYIADNPNLAAQLDDPDFKLNEESILRIVKAYNLETYKPGESISNNVSTVLFYVKDKTNSMDSLSITVNDGEATLLPKGRAMAVRLFTNKFNKVCVNGYCELLLGAECFIKYMEIFIDNKPFQITFTQVSAEDANRYFTYYNNNLK